MKNTKSFLKISIICFVVIINLIIINSAHACDKLSVKSWGTAEHLFIGNKVNLYFCEDDSKICNIDKKITQNAADVLLELDNGIKLTFGEILALAGDYFADGDNPITGSLYDNILKINENDFDNIHIPSNNQLDDISDNFKNHFITLSANYYAERTIELVFKYLNGDITLEEAISLGLTRYDTAKNNFDHFMPYSWYAFAIGHKIALEFAAKAGENNSQEDLKYAYAIEAFAQHYLTDTFSAGHLRVPLKALRRFVFFQSNALVLTKFMHDEDNKFGINLYNLNGDYWRAYGDHYFDDDKNSKNAEYLYQAQQIALKQVFEIYLKFKNQTINNNQDININYQELFNQLRKVMPMINNDNNYSDNNQNSPLFSTDSNDNIYVRYDINKLQDKETSLLTQFGAMTLLIQKLFEYDPS